MPPQWLVQSYESIWWGIFTWSLTLALGVAQAAVFASKKERRPFSWFYASVSNMGFVLITWQNTWISTILVVGKERTGLILPAILLDLVFVILLISGPTKIYLIIEDHFRKRMASQRPA